jgi:hypothetical protein
MTMNTMKPIGQFLHREPDAAQAELLAHVVELARAWERGDLGLDSLRAQCSGFDRFQALRFAGLDGEDADLLRRLVGALVADDEGDGRAAPVAPSVAATARLMMHSENAAGAIGQSNVAIDVTLLGDAGYVSMTNYRGVRVWVSPLVWIHGEPIYPPVHLPPGEERRMAEAAIHARYEAYRRDRKRGGGTEPKERDA